MFDRTIYTHAVSIAVCICLAGGISGCSDREPSSPTSASLVEAESQPPIETTPDEPSHELSAQEERLREAQQLLQARAQSPQHQQSLQNWRPGVGLSQARFSESIMANNRPLSEVIADIESKTGIVFQLRAEASQPVSFWLNDPSFGELIGALSFSGDIEIEMLASAMGAVITIIERDEDSRPESFGQHAAPLDEISSLRTIIEGPMSAENMPLGSAIQILHSESGVPFVLGAGIADNMLNFSLDSPSVAEILDKAVSLLDLEAFGVNTGERYVIYLKRNE